MDEREPTRVSLVGTVHGESGRANAPELVAILERLQPDVIFAEIPATDLANYLDRASGRLESMAVVRYREHHAVSVVAVDLDKPNDEFFRNSEDMFKKVSRTSPDYRRLMDQHSLDTRAHGFPYLNSDRCVQVWADIYDEVHATIEWIGRAELRQIHDLWRDTNHRRDAEMLKNIGDYCKRNAVAHGVLLIGAAHRRSIVDKVRAQGNAAALRVEWRFAPLAGICG